MAKRAIVMYLEQARIYGEDLSVTRSEVLLTKPDGKAVLPINAITTNFSFPPLLAISLARRAKTLERFTPL